jgi:hypothetical protein
MYGLSCANFRESHKSLLVIDCLLDAAHADSLPAVQSVQKYVVP